MKSRMAATRPGSHIHARSGAHEIAELSVTSAHSAFEDQSLRGRLSIWHVADAAGFDW